MKWRNVLCSLIALLLLAAAPVFSRLQDAAAANPSELTAAKPPKPQFFAGLVTEADSSHVKISRDLIGRPTETRVFALDRKTKTPKGGVKVKSRVTVRYQHMPEQDLALEIQVRPPSRTPKAS